MMGWVNGKFSEVVIEYMGVEPKIGGKPSKSMEF